MSTMDKLISRSEAELLSRNEQQSAIITTQRSIITVHEELNATNDSIIALLKKDNDRLTEENAMMRTKLAPYLAQEEEDRAENAIDLEQYMGYTKPRTGTFVPYPREQDER